MVIKARKQNDLFEMPRGYRSAYAVWVKRPLDFAAALISLVVLSPLLLLIGASVLVVHGRPVIFVQERSGLHDRVFRLYKFRTMTDALDEDELPLDDELRLTRFGRFLRSTSLDELPELLNILKGDMSFVGPRPLLVRYLSYYTDWERQRSCVRPGLTGLAQVRGRNESSWSARFAADVEYVQNLSPLMDIRILLRTAAVVLNRSGIKMGASVGMDDLDVERSRVISCGEGARDDAAQGGHTPAHS